MSEDLTPEEKQMVLSVAVGGYPEKTVPLLAAQPVVQNLLLAALLFLEQGGPKAGQYEELYAVAKNGWQCSPEDYD